MLTHETSHRRCVEKSDARALGMSGALLYVLWIACSAALGGFLFGFDTAIINGTVLALQGHFQATAWAIGFAVSIALLGSVVGAWLAGPMADRMGRTPAMVVGAVLFFVSSIGSGWPFTLYDFIWWRVVGGVGVGMASVLAPAYIAEVAPAAWRGRLGSLQQLAVVTGILVALLVNYLLAHQAGGADQALWGGAAAWRWMFWSEAPAALLYGVCAFFLPESPRYLVLKGLESEAARILGRTGDTQPEARVLQIKQALKQANRPRFGELMSGRNLLPVVWIGIILSLLQQFVGINVIFYYSSALWQSVGFTEAHALYVTVITGVINLLTTFLAIGLVDRWGRKPLLIAGSLGMTLSLGMLAFFFGTAAISEAGQPILGAMAVPALLAANLFVFCFGFSWGPIVWVLLGEMFPSRIRVLALGLAASAQWIGNFLISTTFPPMAESLGLGPTYSLYATASLISILFVWFYVPETKGKELEEM